MLFSSFKFINILSKFFLEELREKFKLLQGRFSFNCEFIQQYGLVNGIRKQQRIW